MAHGVKTRPHTIDMSLLFHGLSKTEIPPQDRWNFRHLYLDIAWFGILNASSISFISVYFVRLGASAFQVGLLNAIPAIVTLLLSLPSGWWLKSQRVDRATFWSSVFFRFFYFLFVPLPMMFSEQMQIWLILAITLLMSVPGTVLAVGFNAMFADAVPPEWRGHVVGIRNALLAVTYIITSLVCGALFEWLPFPLNYQVVFGLGFLGAAMSSYHLYQVRLAAEPPPRVGRATGDLAAPGLIRVLGDAVRPGVGLRFLTRIRARRFPRFSVLRGPFGKVFWTLFAFHLTAQLAIPLFPVFWVERLRFSDQTLSVGNALFYGMIFLGSTQLGRLTDRLGNHRLMVIGALMMAGYPGLTAVTHEVELYLFTSVVGGLAWSLAGGALGNYLLEKIPAGERPAHLAWYMIALNAAILLGSLGGPWLAEWAGLRAAFGMIAAGRVLSALGLWRWGR